MTNALSNLDVVMCRGRVDIGGAVRQSRQTKGYSVEDLSLTCGLTAAEITRIELGVDVDPARLRRIAAALQVPTSTFRLAKQSGPRLLQARLHSVKQSVEHSAGDIV